MDSLALDLLDKMLTINPDDRITAKEALEHPYFKSDPLPCDLSEMPKIEKDCHFYVLNSERKNNANAMNINNNPANVNAGKNPNAYRGPNQQNNNYPQNRSYNNSGQGQPTHQGRPHHNQGPNNRRHSRDASGGHSNTHRQGGNAGHGNQGHSNTSSDKSQKPNSYSIIPGNIPNKESTLGPALTSLFKQETVTNPTATQSHNVSKDTKEVKNDVSKSREQNKPNTSNPQNGDKTKRSDTSHQDHYNKSHENTTNKRKPSHELDEFEQLTKKRQIDPIGQNS